MSEVSIDTSEFDKTCALCGEEGWRDNPLRRRVALNGDRLLAHTPCWEDDSDDVYVGDPSLEWAVARAAYVAAAGATEGSRDG